MTVISHTRLRPRGADESSWARNLGQETVRRQTAEIETISWAQIVEDELAAKMASLSVKCEVTQKLRAAKYRAEISEIRIPGTLKNFPDVLSRLETLANIVGATLVPDASVTVNIQKDAFDGSKAEAWLTSIEAERRDFVIDAIYMVEGLGGLPVTKVADIQGGGRSTHMLFLKWTAEAYCEVRYKIPANKQDWWKRTTNLEANVLEGWKTLCGNNDQAAQMLLTACRLLYKRLARRVLDGTLRGEKDLKKFIEVIHAQMPALCQSGVEYWRSHFHRVRVLVKKAPAPPQRGRKPPQPEEEIKVLVRRPAIPMDLPAGTAEKQMFHAWNNALAVIETRYAIGFSWECFPGGPPSWAEYIVHKVNTLYEWASPLKLLLQERRDRVRNNVLAKRREEKIAGDPRKVPYEERKAMEQRMLETCAEVWQRESQDRLASFTGLPGRGFASVDDILSYIIEGLDMAEFNRQRSRIAQKGRTPIIPKLGELDFPALGFSSSDPPPGPSGNEPPEEEVEEKTESVTAPGTEDDPA